jgi:hypothetical protein
VAPEEAAPLCAALPGIAADVAPATVYGFGLDAGILWNVNSAEI